MSESAYETDQKRPSVVWVVHWDYYDDWGNCAVFDNEKAAQECTDALNSKGGRLGDASVEEWPVQSSWPSEKGSSTPSDSGAERPS